MEKNASFSLNRKHATKHTHSLILSSSLTYSTAASKWNFIPNFITEIAATTHSLRIHDAATCWQPQSIVFQIKQTLDIRHSRQCQRNFHHLRNVNEMWQNVCVCVFVDETDEMFFYFQMTKFPFRPNQKKNVRFKLKRKQCHSKFSLSSTIK